MNLCGSLTLILALVIGGLYSGALTRIGIFDYIDDLELAGGNKVLMGMFPATHAKKPFGFTPSDMPNLQGQTYVVTGGNVGLGKWTAHYIAKAGGRVVVACRSVDKCKAAVKDLQEETGSKKIDPMVLDLASFKSIKSFSEMLSKKYPEINGLVLNAGIMVCPFALTEDGIESQIGVNHFGHFYLTQLLLPLLEKSANAATVTVVSSSEHYSSYAEGVKLSLEQLNDPEVYELRNAYGQSKLANVLFAQELAVRVKAKNILVNSLHPGYVDTELIRHVVSQFKVVFGDRIGDFLYEYVFPRAGRGLWSPEQAALTQVYCAVSKDIRAKKITGKYFHPIARQAQPDKLHASNVTLQKKFWELSEQVIKSKTSKM